MIPVFLTTCSRNKIGYSAGQYDSYANATPVPKRILNCRGQLFDSISRQELKGVIKGPDFEKESKMDGCYLPAYIRYARGQFMASLEGALREGERSSCVLDELLDCWFEDNRLFFLSGLYGIISSSEPIQNYDVRLEGEPADHWKNNQDSLTDFLLESIEKESILLDCCGETGYSELLNWTKIEDEDFKVLHAIDPYRSHEDGQVRAASGAIAASVSEERLKQMMGGEIFQDVNADIKFVRNEEFQKSQPTISSNLPQIGVINTGLGEYDQVEIESKRSEWYKYFKFVPIDNKEALKQANRTGMKQCICIIPNKGHSYLQKWGQPEKVFKGELIMVRKLRKDLELKFRHRN